MDRTELNAKGELRNQTTRDNAKRTYGLIMRDKEKLLSFETKDRQNDKFRIWLDGARRGRESFSADD